MDWSPMQPSLWFLGYGTHGLDVENTKPFGRQWRIQQRGQIMNRREFETLLLTLESTPALLLRAADSLGPAEALRRPSERAFSFVESVWHLADLEREGYGVRIRRILAEENPAFANFDGARLDRERAYQERDVETGLASCERALAENLEMQRRLWPAEWNRCGSQEGVGRVTLSDIPR